ncbi:MAG: riboflavin synthase [Desulfomonilaceae bacterium]
MFTGIIEARGSIVSIDHANRFECFTIKSNMDLSDVKLGDSIAVDGVCLTVTNLEKSANIFSADVSPESMRVTTLGSLRPGAEVNLEKALTLNSRLGGHLVAGHVDCIGVMVENKAVGQGYLLGFQVDSCRYVVEKGSVAINGVSLTVNRVEGNRFWVMIIPHTANLTGLTQKKINDKVNVEYDIVGKYIEKFVSGSPRSGGVTEKTLRDHGFI